MTELKFDSKGLIPAIVQEEKTGKVLMLAYMNLDTLKMTRETGYTHFYSRSRGQIWKKGETSGNVQKVKKIFYDCDNDTILVTVEAAGPACHTGNEVCFYTELNDTEDLSSEPVESVENILPRIYQVIQQRKKERPKGSYVAGLFDKGEEAILKKIGEESVELVMACKNKNRGEIVYEAADLWFHSLVALAVHDVMPEEVFKELKKRFK